MRQAITTRFAGPTESRGSRIIVKSQAGRKTVAWDHALDASENHARAAYLYARSLGWVTDPKRMSGGGMPDGSGYCWVINDGETIHDMFPTGAKRELLVKGSL